MTVYENIYSLFTRRFPSDRRKPVIETPAGDHYSYGDLDRESARYARFLAGLGLRPGDRVAVQIEKSPAALFLYLACLRAGLIYLPLNPAYRAAEIEYYLDDAAPGAVVCRPSDLDGMRELARPRGLQHIYTLDSDGQGSLTEAYQSLDADFDICSVSPDDNAVLLYTSGTTGRPKGAMITHGNLAANGLALHQAWGWRADDVLLHALPLFHIHGLFVACHCVLLCPGPPCSWASRRSIRACWPIPPSGATSAAACGCSSPAPRRCYRRPSTNSGNAPDTRYSNAMA
jgi:malonyl-CoA/methylmalonyl-CoA synthetase